MRKSCDINRLRPHPFGRSDLSSIDSPIMRLTDNDTIIVVIKPNVELREYDMSYIPSQPLLRKNNKEAGIER